MSVITTFGRISKTPEIEESKDGAKFCKFSLAEKRSKQDGNGGYVDNPNWFDCIAYSYMAEKICKFAQKGDMLFISGSHDSYDSVVAEKKIKRWTFKVKECQLIPTGNKKSAEETSDNITEEFLDDDMPF